jgi:N-acetylmuramoyl-L-alanine amidase
MVKRIKIPKINRKISEIIIHCTAARPEWFQGRPLSDKIENIRQFHKTPGVLSAAGASDIGYHLLIDRDGTIGFGRPLDQTGAHTRNRNTGTIGIALLGGFGSNENHKFEQHFTKEQDEALVWLIKELQKQTGPVILSGHNQYAAKACPGFRVPLWLAERGL